MKIIRKDLKNGLVKLEAENLNDLWYLSQVIELGDLISGRTLRKIRVEASDRAQKVSRRPVFMEICAEKVEFSRSSDILRVTGKITKGPEDVPLGTYHTFNIAENTIFSLVKEEWLSYQLARIIEASKETDAKILLVVAERDEAFFAILEKYGYTFLSTYSGEVQKKDMEQRISGDFYKGVSDMLEAYDKRYNLSRIVLGSPSFWKEEILSRLPETLKKKVILATVGSVGKRSFDELLRRKEVQQALRDERVGKEVMHVERLFDEISKTGLCSYGIDEVEKASSAGAAETVLVADTFIWKMREEGNYKRLEGLLKAVERAKGTVVIVSHKHEAGKKLEGIGGIGAILRYKLEY